MDDGGVSSALDAWAGLLPSCRYCAATRTTPTSVSARTSNQFVTLTLTLLVGALKQLTTLGAFAVVLWNLSGALTVPIGSETFTIYGYMFWLSLLYAGVAASSSIWSDENSSG